MIGTRRAALAGVIVMSAIGVACASPAPNAFAAKSEASTHFTLESVQVYEKQLAGGQIMVARFNPKKHSIHLTLKDGRKVRVVYPPQQRGKYTAALKASGVTISASKAPSPSHKRRYIFGGIALVVLIVVVVGVVLVLRRKRANAE
jgi:hypothetical protein